ncbi:hypothetical protein [Muricoccus aerilatus]|uniref:hypothetical protein n=1 Tax=Muricoccus aerilatus TaxID=452982 RepID=UPI0005C1C450|nr:hypothetical protein [Roseomonas aerilata]
MIRPLLIPALLALGALPALARLPTPAEQGGIEAALRGAGYVSWESIDVPPAGGRIVVEGARRAPDGPARLVLVEPATMRVTEEVPAR